LGESIGAVSIFHRGARILTAIDKSARTYRVTTDQKPEPISVTVKECKRLSGLGHTTIYKLLGEGKLASTKVGRRTLISFPSLKKLPETRERAE
jgi:excisionase family DNA binding protein